MLAGSVTLNIITIIILLIFAFVIHLRLEKDIKRAFLLLSLLVITLFLGILVNNLIGPTPVEPVPNTHNTSDESNTAIDDTTVVSVDDSIATEDNTGRGSDSSGDNSREGKYDSRSLIRRIIDLISPATKPFAGKINKDCFIDKVLFWFIIFMEISSFGGLFEEDLVDHRPVWVFALMPFIWIINSYICYIIAFFFSIFFTGDSFGWSFFINTIVFYLSQIIAVLEAYLIGKLVKLSTKE